MPPRLIDAPRCCQVRQFVHHARVQRLSTSSTCKAAQIPPESPKFIEIPRPVQPSQPFPVHMKGVLPVPRQIFRRRPKPQDTDKASPEYLADVTPEPIEDKASTASNTDPRTAEFVSWKARQAEARRRNLRESLIELSNRKQRQDRWLAARSNKKQADRNALLSAPERDDERLTNPSVLQSEMPEKHHALPDPDREARLARKRQNVADMEAMREGNRRNALHTLYVNAGNFITTGAQLDSTIDKVFDDLNQFNNDSTAGANVWNLGFPETVQQLLGKANQTPGKKAIDAAEGNAGITRERMRKIAEELTGGKMEDAR
ncbi:hypothetical protein OEA41_000260 [Lepraria neglecta]|uniref:Uncharacterized protein n=1 Tax=Lepraria neglecta TaxID=209136 RepID=A0AAD9ZIA7_9LECA|nr:hypothetical protein OEA41_000260 [Lepraria neglecta]